MMTKWHLSEPNRVLLIKILLLGGALILAWPVPAMIGFSNPAEAQILGRYTLKYFGLMVIYVGLAGLWLATTLWTVIRLTPVRLENVRQVINRHIGLFALSTILILTGLTALRAIQLAGLMVFPGTYNQAMTRVPGLVVFLLTGILLLISGPSIVLKLEERLSRVPRILGLSNLSTWLRQRNWRQAAILAALLLIFGVLAGIALKPAFWNYPLTIDSSVHLYVGQHLLRGGTPYVTYNGYWPMRHGVSALWSLGAMLTGIPIVTFSRIMEIVTGGGILLFTYLIGRDLTRSSTGGLLSAVILLGTEHLQELIIYGPNFRLTTVLTMLVGIWAGQKGRWFWAGIFTLLSTLIYPPAMAVTAVLGVAALLQKKQPRWQAALRLVAGAAAVVSVTALVLLLAGTLDDALPQTVFPLVRRFFPGLVPTATGGGLGLQVRQIVFPSGRPLSWYVTVFAWVLRGDWELVALMLLGLILLFATKRLRDILTTPETTAVLFPALLWPVLALIDFDGSLRDTVMIVAPLAPFGAVALLQLFTWLKGSLQEALPHLKLTLAAVCFALLLAYGLADNATHQNFLFSLANITLDMQQEMVDQIEDSLTPEDTVLSLGSFWYLNLSERDNILPIRWWSEGLFASGNWTREEENRAISENQPALAIILQGDPSLLPEWLLNDYVCVGTIDVDGRGFPEDVYVRQDREDLQAIIQEGWPLQDPG